MEKGTWASISSGRFLLKLGGGGAAAGGGAGGGRGRQEGVFLMEGMNTLMPTGRQFDKSPGGSFAEIRQATSHDSS